MLNIHKYTLYNLYINVLFMEHVTACGQARIQQKRCSAMKHVFGFDFH